MGCILYAAFGETSGRWGNLDHPGQREHHGQSTEV